MTAALVAADKPIREVLELQRDVARLEEVVKTLQRSLDDRMGAMETKVQGASDAAGKAVAAAAQVQRSVDQLARDMDQKLGTPVASLGGRVDQISGNVATVQQAVADLTAAVNKLSTQMADLSMVVKAAQSPAAAPAAPMGATEMLANADRDAMSGKHELALSEYEEYLKWYGDSPQAGQAWYSIGSIQLALKDNEKAIKAFDTVISKYPSSSKAPEALFYKARALTELGRVKEAIDTRAELRRRFPKSPLATQR